MNKQKLIDKNNKAENAKWQVHLYQEGNLVLLQKGTKNKYKTLYQGSYSILKVNDNGTVCLRVGAVKDTYNIRRITPYTLANVPDHGGQCSMQVQQARRTARWQPLKGQEKIHKSSKRKVTQM